MSFFDCHKIILLSDLECDFLNTKQGCKQLNKVSTNPRPRAQRARLLSTLAGLYSKSSYLSLGVAYSVFVTTIQYVVASLKWLYLLNQAYSSWTRFPACLTLHICVSRIKRKITCPLIPIWLMWQNTLYSQSIDPAPAISANGLVYPQKGPSWIINNRQQIVAIDLFYSLFPGPHLLLCCSLCILHMVRIWKPDQPFAVHTGKG